MYSELKACILPPLKRNNKRRKTKHVGVYTINNGQNSLHYYSLLSGILAVLHKRLLNLRHIQKQYLKMGAITCSFSPC